MRAPRRQFNYQGFVPQKIKDVAEKVMRKSYDPRFLLSFSDFGYQSYMVEINLVKGRKSPGCYDTEYYAQIIYFPKEELFELSEAYIPTDVFPGTKMNIFGYFKSLRGALQNLMDKGNTTMDDRKPIDIYL